MANSGALIVEGTRGRSVETVHEVHAVVLGPGGREQERYGEGTPATPIRSTGKLIQALALLRTGAADAYQVSVAELALACASHSAEDGHRRAVLDWLRRLELSAGDLRCGPDPVGHGCSGKHTGLLTVSRHLGADPQRYLDPFGAVQTIVLDLLRERCRVDLDPADLAVDGCAAPVAAMSLTDLGRGLGSLAGDDDPDGARILAAIRTHPWQLGGTGRFDTDAVEASRGRLITKVGADGLHIAILTDGTTAVAKALSGSNPAAQVGLVEILRASGAWPDRLDAHARPVITNSRGDTVGEFRPRKAARRAAR
ncbi:MAG: asparaginase [Nocardioides sp.]